MNVQTPDVLTQVDRTPGVAASVNAVSTMPTQAMGLDRAAIPRLGETFAQVMNRRMVAKGAAVDTKEAGASKSFAELLNQSKVVRTENEEGQQAGESTIGYLNRRHQVTVNEKQVGAATAEATAKAVAKAAAGKTGLEKRAGETAVQTLNGSRETDPVAERHATAEKAAEGLVSNALILPVLKQLRRSTLGEKSVFSGGNGEKAFGPEFDMQLADRIARSPRLAVKEALVTRLENRSSSVPATSAKRSVQQAGSNGIKAASRIDVNG